MKYQQQAMFQSSLKKTKSLRSSPIRDNISLILRDKDNPLTAKELMTELKFINLLPNKTSVYRALETLLKMKKIIEVDFLEGQKRYEIAPEKGQKKYHFISNDGQILYLDIQKEVQKLEKQIAKKYNLRINSSVVEFFGETLDTVN
jgi:Fe2+ or Zn2+ uptake regulation protein